jgi:hypothetical protein
MGSCDTVTGTEPFQYAIIDNLLAADFYEELATSFPFGALSQITGERGLYKQPGKSIHRFDGMARSNAGKFLSRIDGVWTDFFSWTQSGALSNLINRTFKRDFGSDLVQFEISAIGADGGAVHPHYDSGSKIVSGIYYIPQPGWQKSWGGQFRLLRYIGAESAPEYPVWKDCAADVRVPYVPNRLTLFRVKKYVSYHGVKPMTGPAGAMRTSVTFALMREDE